MSSTSSTAASGSPKESAADVAGTPVQGATPSCRHWVRWVLGSLAILAVVFVTVTMRFFVFPPTDQPRHVDGIVSFNGPDEELRAAKAVSLAEEGYSSVLLFSQGGARTDTGCPKVPQVSVVCFVDATNNTRGEAEWAGQYAENHHWQSLLIVPGRAQATRARLLTERCFAGQVVVVSGTKSDPAFSQIIHEWGGMVEALFIRRSC
jgi:hypothetical protein